MNLRDRKSNVLLEAIKTLRESLKKIRRNHPLKINSAVILPNHIYLIMTLPAGDSNYAMRWNLIKGEFSKQISLTEAINQSRRNKNERGIWQRRF